MDCAADDELARRAQRGDAAAFGRLFDRHHRFIFRFLARRLDDPEAARDATQETFVRALRQIGTLRSPGRVLPWLFGVSRRVLAEALRARAVRAPAFAVEAPA